MSAVPDPQPVFVVGAPRSGSRLLAWGLAEHPRFDLLPREGWVGSMAAALGPVAREATGTPPSAARDGSRSEAAEGFLGPLRRAAAELLGGDDGVRWVDGAPANAFHMWGLSRLLPGARFIHVLREVEEVVHHLTSSPTPDASYYTRETAAEAWLRHVEAALKAEVALGCQVVHRVLHRDLVRDSRGTVSECLEFLGEVWCEACLRPLRGIRAAEASGARPPAAGGDPAPSRLRTDARALSAGLLGSEGDLALSPDEARRRLDGEFLLGPPGAGGGGARSPVDRIHALVRLGVPEGSTVLVVSRGDEDLVRIPGRRGWHFPQSEGGVYAGHHPGDSAEAVAHLEMLRSRGADYLVIPCTAYWWLEHYEGLRAHLDTRARLVAFHEDVCLLFALSPSEPEEEDTAVRSDEHPGAAGSMDTPACPIHEEVP